MIVIPESTDLDKVWFTSDHHFSHLNIIEYCHRPFKDVEEMDAKLIGNWNEVVGEDHTVYHLGDFTLGSNALDYLIQLNGRINILAYEWHHDQRWLKHSVMDTILKRTGNRIRMLRPLEVLKVRPLVSRSMFNHTLRITLCHYPMLQFEGCYHGHLHLHGHAHGNVNRIGSGKGQCMDVGVDCHDYYPVNLEYVWKNLIDLWHLREDHDFDQLKRWKEGED